MSTDAHNRAQQPDTLPVHDTVAYEEKDVKAGSIYVYLLLLAAAVIVAYVAAVFILRATVSLAEKSATPPPPVRQEMTYNPVPPEPRLQGVPSHPSDPQLDLRMKLQQDMQANQRAGWIDRSRGIAQIPVSDAMRIIAEKGLPAPPPENEKARK